MVNSFSSKRMNVDVISVLQLQVRFLVGGNWTGKQLILAQCKVCVNTTINGAGSAVLETKLVQLE
jgi:hypothetical protein